MRRLLTLILLLVLAVAPVTRADQRPVIAILPFANLKDSGALAWLGVTGELVAARLRGIPGVVVVSPEEVRRVAGELEATGSKGLDLEAAHKLAAMLGADKVLTGGFEQTGGKIRLVARWLDPDSSQFTTVAELRSAPKEALRLPGQLAQRLLDDEGVTPSAAARKWLAAPAARSSASIEAYRQGLDAYWQQRPADNEKAIALLLKAAAEPGFDPAQIALGQAYYAAYAAGWSKDRHTLEMAATAAQVARGRSRLWLDASLLMGRSQAALGDMDKASAAYAAARDVNPDDPEAYAGLADLAERNGQDGEALALYRQALERRSGAAEVHAALGHALMKSTRWDEAAEQFEAALALRPRWEALYAPLGDSRLHLKNLDAARQAFERGLALNTDDWEAQYGLGRVHAAAGRWAEAIGSYQQALAHNAGYAYVYTALGEAYFSLHRLDEAINAYHAALKLRPDDVSINYNLAALYAMAQKSSNALQFLEKAIGLDPSMAEAAGQDKDFDNIRKESKFQELIRPR